MKANPDYFRGRSDNTRTLKETFFNAVSVTSLEGLNQSLHQWVKEKNETIHRVTGKRPIDLKAQEKLRPLPLIGWKNVTVHLPVLPTKTGFLIFDNNQYSVPDYLVGKSLSIHSSPTFVEIYDGERKAASHPRCFGRKEKKENPLHRSLRNISSEMKRERILSVIKNMNPAVETFLNQNEGVGEDPYETAYQIFKRLSQISRGLLISALSECLRRRSPRLKTLLSFLNHQPAATPETVSPQRGDLLEISYTPRPLEDYENDA